MTQLKTSRTVTAIAPAGQASADGIPCMLAGQASKPRLKAVTKTVNVAIGRTTGMAVPCEYWATTDTDFDYGYGYEAVYDPKRISLADAEKWVSTQLAEQGVKVAEFINEDGAEATRRRMLDTWNEVADLAKARGVHTPAVERFHDEMALLLAVAPNPAATLDRLMQVFARERAKSAPNACHVYPGLCIVEDGESGDAVDEHGRHYDHAGHSYTVPSATRREDPEIWAEFVHVSAGTPHIGFMGETLTPAQAREKAVHLRKFADEMDALADQVEVAVVAAEQVAGK
ncbi:hypothetical protein [Streptomyces stelliscabiei]|uniref:Uncharacterized protein YndB with AHSA1/START domain n=1 Tax=Streptomyces stelliscabiei TaxID=146820 RepID=A0A8I0PCX6_9ACTN|nr:hypothetical protein [Streptomyces stelliscabiei]KND40100.1 hypothetical protein IQ64_35865 [Streptomyces stelliscabiei]MBE1601299.1 uncharacterized protein YndB with AHSA1/START domain [Streptomyces stelliscabiei]